MGLRLQSCLREADLLVRWGGDEFIVVLADVTTLQDVERACDRIIASFATDLYEFGTMNFISAPALG